MKCPKCQSTDVTGSSWELSVHKQYSEGGDLVGKGHQDSLVLGWFPEAEMSCQNCPYSGYTEEFAGPIGTFDQHAEEIPIAYPLDYLLQRRYVEISYDDNHGYFMEGSLLLALLAHLGMNVSLQEIKRLHELKVKTTEERSQGDVCLTSGSSPL